MRRAEVEPCGQMWDALLGSGFIARERPSPFVDIVADDVTQTVSGVEPLGARPGLYSGIGSGLNFLALDENTEIKRLHGCDVSSQCIARLIQNNQEAHPGLKNQLFVGKIENYGGARIFNYIVSIQTMQYAGRQALIPRFVRMHQALKPGGKLYLQVSSANGGLPQGELVEKVAEDPTQGVTVGLNSVDVCGENLPLHLYTKKELQDIANECHFDVLTAPDPIDDSGLTHDGIAFPQLQTTWQRPAEFTRAE